MTVPPTEEGEEKKQKTIDGKRPSTKRHPYQMPEQLQLTHLDVKEEWLYPVYLSDDWTSPMEQWCPGKLFLVGSPKANWSWGMDQSQCYTVGLDGERPRTWCPLLGLVVLESLCGVRPGGGAHQWAPGSQTFTHGAWLDSAQMSYKKLHWPISQIIFVTKW